MQKNYASATQTMQEQEGENYAPATETVLFGLKHLTFSARWLYLQMCYLSGSGTRCFEQLEELAEHIGLMTRQTRNLLDELEEAGLIEPCAEQERLGRNRYRTVNYYHINKFPIKSRFSRTSLKVVQEQHSSHNSGDKSTRGEVGNNKTPKQPVEPTAEELQDSAIDYTTFAKNCTTQTQEADNSHVSSEYLEHELMNHESSVCVKQNYSFAKEPKNNSHNQGSISHNQPQTASSTNQQPFSNQSLSAYTSNSPSDAPQLVSSPEPPQSSTKILNLLLQAEIAFEKAEYLARITTLADNEVQEVIEIANDPARSYRIDSPKGLIAHAVENSYIPDIRRRGISGANPTSGMKISFVGDGDAGDSQTSFKKPRKPRNNPISASSGPIDLTKYQSGGKYAYLTQQEPLDSDLDDATPAETEPPVFINPIDPQARLLIKQIDPQACDWIRAARLDGDKLLVTFGNVGKMRYEVKAVNDQWLPELQYHGISQVVFVD